MNRFITAVIAVACTSFAQAQLSVSPQTDLQELARTITGPGVSISNPQINCNSQGYGEFQYAGSLLGIDEGILLTSGKIANAVGPNNAENTTFDQGYGGNSILDIVTGRTTKDACKFEFDVIPAGDSLRFDFVFGSEEYNEWVGSQYNDVFGFFISGPGITGDAGIGIDKNIALIPGTSQAVTINNVNNGSNASYFHDNAGGQHIQYDGVTTGLSAFSTVQPCATYHLKLIVADASDRKFDSGVFIAKVKSNPITMQLVTQSGADSLIEGCNSGSVRFMRQQATSQPLTLEYYLQGSATNGTDYAAIGAVDPNTPKSITIPANQSYVDQPIDPIVDGIPEGLETLLFILGNPYCPSVYADSLEVPLVDSLNASVQPTISTICLNGQVQLLATGGTQYTWTPANGLSATNIANPIAQPNSTQQYSVTVQDGGCSQTLQCTVKVSDMTITANTTRPLCNAASNGAINISLGGGIAPYSFQWSGPNSFSATTEDITNITAGTYTVTVTDAACTKTQSFNVGQPAPLSVSLSPSLLIFGQNISCSGGHDGSIDATITGGTGPYTVNWTGPNGYISNSVDIGTLGAGTYSIAVSDASGCTATANTTLLESAPMNAAISATSDVACANDADGSATVDVTGGMPNYTYSWSTVPAQTGATASGLSPGIFTVIATDQYGCVISTAATITGPTQQLNVQLTAKTDVTCFGAANGSATISVSGGTVAYGISWNTTPVQTGTTAVGLSGGSYTATITDANSCGTTLQVTIAEPAQPLAVAITAQTNILCHGQATGSATVSASGGSGPYAYSWNTTPARNGASQTGLNAGSYTVTVTDVHGCTTTQSVEITAPAVGLSASINASTDVLCAGGSNGSATVAVTGGTSPYSYLWNTTPPQSGASATGLASGTWQVSIVDANQCSTSASVTIAQPTPLVAIGTISPALCQGAASGAVDVSTSGGTTPYSWSWTGPASFTANTEDISSLNAGGYTLTVTDGNGCSITRSFDVNQPGLFTVSAIPSVHGNANVSCPNSTDGAIDLTVSGAVPPYSFVWSGPGSFNVASEDIAGLQAGTYSVSITDDNGCSTDLDVTLLAPPPIAVQTTLSNFGGTSISCNGGSNGSITAQISGGNAPYTTAWTGPSGFSSAQTDLTGLSAGTYQLAITDANGCMTDQVAEITQPFALTATNGGTSPASCFGSATGQATVHVTGGRSPYSYTWNTNPAQHAATSTGLSAGSYTVSVTDANGCTTTATMTVGGPIAALAILPPSITNVLCHGSNTGAATAQATGGTAPYTYTWNTSPQTNGPTATGLVAGTFIVTVTDAAGCTTSRNVIITQPQQPLAATVANRHYVTCFGDNDGSISIVVTGGSGNYNITWNTSPVQTGSTATGLATGNYVATIADANGCTQTLDFPVSIDGPAAPLALTYVPFTFPGGAHVSCPGNSDGSIDVTVTGGTPNYAYSWQDGMGGTFNMQDPTGLSAGTYQLIIGDGHGCQVDTTITLVAPPLITATANVHSAICHGASDGSIDMTAAGGVAPYSYQWSGPGSFTAGTQDLNMIGAGVYMVVITDANGCSIDQPFDVTEPGTFSFNATLSPVACNNSTDGSIQLTASGGTAPYQYDWSGPNGYNATTANINGLAAGTYNLILTDDNGCSALSSQTLTAPSSLSVYTFSNKDHSGYDISCNGSSDGVINTTYSGGTPPYSFAWTGPGGFTASTADITGLAAGTYTLTLTDDNGCSVVAITTLVAPPVLSATAVAGSFAGGSGTSCNGIVDGSIVLTPAGGTPPYAVTWSGPSGFTSSAWQITGLAAGSYTATVSDANGCSTTASATLTAPLPLELTSTSTDIMCNGGNTGSADLSVSGGSGIYSYQWSGPNVFTASTQDISNLIAGTYTVTVVDANGCTASTSVTIVQPTAIQATAIITTAACQGANTGAVDLTMTGGTGGYSYLWTGFPAFSATTEDIGPLFAGVYSLTVTDDNGCTYNTSYNVGEPGLFDITAELSSVGGGYNVSCADASDGSIDANVSGGTGPLNYFWTGPNGFTSINLDLTGLPSGQYSLTVHDVNGCNGTASFTLTAPSPIIIGLITTAQPACNGGNDGSIEASILGGTAPYSSSWTGPNGSLGISQNLTGVGAGTYVITVTDALGCSATGSITLTSPAGIDAIATAHEYANGANLSCTYSSDGSIDLDITGGAAPYQVTWNGPTGYHFSGEDINGLVPGTYTATITDANGCNAVAQVNLVAPAPLDLAITTSSYSSGNAISCSGAADGSITLITTGGNPGYTTSWTGPNGFTSQQTVLHDLGPGSYSVVIYDASGCTANADVNLIAPPPITTSAVLSDHGGFEVGCGGTDGSIDLTAAGGLAPYQFSWTGPNGFAASDEDLMNITAGSYTVAITDANGCSTSRSFTLNAPENLTTALTVTSNECDLSANGTIALTVSGGVGPFDISWTGPNGFTSIDENITGLASGDYAVTVTSAMGCIATANAAVIAAAPMTVGLYASNYGSVNIPCHGDSSGTIELAVSGGFAPLNIAWTGPGGFIADTADISGLMAGTYAVTITDDHGCMRDTSITLIEPDSALTTVLSATDAACNGSLTGSINATVTGGAAPYTFDWRGPDSTQFSTEDLSNIGAGDYELVVTDANQCVRSLSITVSQPDSALGVDFSVVDHNGYNTTCSDASDGAINLTAIGGSPEYTYNWAGPDGFTSVEDSLSDLAAGTYVLSATDANGCTIEQSITIVPALPITVELSAATFASGTNISCFGMNDGMISAMASGGVNPASPQWSGPIGFSSSGMNIDSLVAGTYCLTVTDDNGCSAQNCVTLSAPDALVAAATTSAAPCGLSTGAVDATITGGSPAYSTVWNAGEQSEDLANVIAGTYTLTVTDANGCISSTTATVAGTPGVEASAGVTGPLCHASTDGAIDLTITSGLAPFTYAWDNGAADEDRSGLAGGEYGISITDGNGCTWDSLITVQAPEVITADTILSHFVNGHNIGSWNGADGSISVDVTGGTPPYTYAWDDGASMASRYGLSAGRYEVTITDSNGCSIQLTIILTQPDDLEMPTGFTPNGDGNNDTFVVRGIEAYPGNQLIVYNRWGNVVFDQPHYTNEWRGENQQGQDLPDGTYFVVLRLNAEITLQNYVDLRR
ncbi:MAG: choice-of-anchor L domain-containing protein [Flavobacteriales bacterium]|nr:choice-of-anchor L domain-containing protein [Flavobacteriales bacterium]